MWCDVWYVSSVLFHQNCNSKFLTSCFPPPILSDFPCYCNPNLPLKIDCPYCSFATNSDLASLLCLKNGQSQTYTSIYGIRTSCSCEIPTNPIDLPITSCVDVPTAAPASGPQTGCTLQNPDTGANVFISNGGSLGNLFTTRCGSSTNWPCFCNANLPDQVECPYCGIEQPNNAFLCAINNQVVSITNITTNQNQTCKCIVPSNGGGAPTLACSPSLPTPAPAAVCTIGSATLVTGQAYTDAQIPPGPCGNSTEWPTLCNPGRSNQTEYPYCIFRNTQDGTVVCAKKSTSVTYTNNQGREETCTCIYLSAALGAQPTCRTPATPFPTRTPVTPPIPFILPTSAPIGPLKTTAASPSLMGESYRWMTLSLGVTVLLSTML